VKANPPSLDPDHEAKRALLSKGGLVLAVAGALCSVIGFGMFVSVFFSDLSTDPPVRPIIGLLMFGGGGFVAVVGLQALAAGNMGRILRYQIGESLPPTMDAARHASPVVEDLARGLGRAARDGWADGGTPSSDSSITHTCGTVNDADDVFCKGCGQRLTGQVCPSCRASNDADARFCDRCGATLTAGV
jgi:hypothetical protein